MSMRRPERYPDSEEWTDEKWKERLTYLLRSVYKAGARAQLDHGRRRALDPVDRLRWLSEQGFGDDIRAVLNEVEDLREAVNPITGAYGITDSALRSWVAEGMHTAFRKGTDHPYATVIHQLITDMPGENWGEVTKFVSDPLITWLRDAQEKAETQRNEGEGNG